MGTTCSSARNYLRPQSTNETSTNLNNLSTVSTNINSTPNQNVNRNPFRIFQTFESKNELSPRSPQINSTPFQNSNSSDSRLIINELTSASENNRLKIDWSSIVVNASKREECLIGQHLVELIFLRMDFLIISFGSLHLPC